MRIPAKINLYLHITGRRADGYHTLDSLMVPVAVYDEVSVSAADNLTLEVSGSYADAAGSSQNIVLRAAELLAAEADIAPNVHICVQKNIPVGAGLGGGSADAAAVLVQLNQLWQLGYTDEKLEQLGLQLGADVPFFIKSEAALVSGIGEGLRPVGALPSCYVVLGNPGVAVSTAEVFRHQPIPFGAAAPRMECRNFEELVAFLQNCRNDLEANAIALCPEIAALLEELRRHPGCRLARMSGSGGTCFALFATEEEAKAVVVSGWSAVSRFPL